ncbi:transposase [Anaerobacillus alkaliphilus]|uniref:Transposase n=1 Tax=Anaerobacillus alkaliphilus TaxID=1548597 RepID=A0A4Q0VTP1_9BACI|nr:transposase [Anaerobacillus alkaliphilus]RXJ00345.1 transposase [Anaerobacillus alkaliphilus]
MPRKARLKSRSGIYHVMIRGINKQIIFEEEEDKRVFLVTLKKYKDICKFELYGYCLMDNHIHLLIRELEETISTVVKRISSSYVYWYNFKYERKGHLFQERFKSETVEDKRYFLTVLRYIHQNPQNAGLSNDIFDTKWTSINEYINKSKIVDTDYALNLFSNNRNEALRLFIEYNKETNDDACMEETDMIRVQDLEIKKYLLDHGIVNTNQLQQMKREDRDDFLRKLKKINGVSIRQLSRVTGISKNVIARIR